LIRKRKGVLFLHRIKLLLSACICLIIIFIASVPVMASSYRYTGTSFRYIGEFIQEKTFGFFDGSGFFGVQGKGLVEGYHDVHSGEKDGEKKTNIKLRLAGTTDSNNALDLARMERAMLDYLELKRAQEIAAVDRLLRESTRMETDNYEAELRKINASYDEMILQVKLSYEEAKKNVRIISQIKTTNTRIQADINVGVEMYPGESGYIEQSVITNARDEGEYLRSTNRISNTGGVTAKDIEVKVNWGTGTGLTSIMSEQMRVDGYAELWETTEVRSGNARGGGWAYTMP